MTDQVNQADQQDQWDLRRSMNKESIRHLYSHSDILMTCLTNVPPDNPGGPEGPGGPAGPGGPGIPIEVEPAGK